MLITNFKEFVNEALKLKRLHPVHDTRIFNYNILNDKNRKVGTLNFTYPSEYYSDGLKVENIFLDPEYRGDDNAKNLLLKTINKLKTKFNINIIEWYAVSQQSGRFALKVFGKPVEVDTYIRSYDTFEEAAEDFSLPDVASVSDKGEILHGEMDSVRLVFKF